jgi:hypothetical protein
MRNSRAGVHLGNVQLSVELSCLQLSRHGPRNKHRFPLLLVSQFLPWANILQSLKIQWAPHRKHSVSATITNHLMMFRGESNERVPITLMRVVGWGDGWTGRLMQVAFGRHKIASFDHTSAVASLQTYREPTPLSASDVTVTSALASY